MIAMILVLLVGFAAVAGGIYIMSGARKLSSTIEKLASEEPDSSAPDSSAAD